MEHSHAPQKHKPTFVRRCLTFGERVRYHLEYRRRLKGFRRQALQGTFGHLSRGEANIIRAFWLGYGIKRINMDWYRLYKGLLGEADPRYIPEEVFRIDIEPILNRRDVAMAYHDKNRLNRLFPEISTPRVVLRNIYGRYFDGNYSPITMTAGYEAITAQDANYILKPAISGTGSGLNVILIRGEHGKLFIEDRPWNLADIERIYVQDFLLQEVVKQHSSLAVFHPGSLNTVRVITFRFEQVIHVLAAVLRMGNGSYVDNAHAGGLVCGIDVETGQLTSFAYDVPFTRYEQHPVSKVSFQRQTITGFNRIKMLARCLHERLDYFDVLAFDVCVCEDETPCLIEINTFGQAIEPFQILKGAPLFGALTEPILELVARRRREGWNRA